MGVNLEDGHAESGEDVGRGGGEEVVVDGHVAEVEEDGHGGGLSRLRFEGEDVSEDELAEGKVEEEDVAGRHGLDEILVEDALCSLQSESTRPYNQILSVRARNVSLYGRSVFKK